MTSTTATETGNSTGTQEQPKSPNKATDTTATIAANDKPINDNNKDDKGSDRKDDQAKANDGANDGAAAATGDQQGTSSPTKTLEPKPTVHKIDYEKDIVYLYQFPRCPTLPSASPFCLKVESWLRMAGIKYEVTDMNHRIASFTRLPRLWFNVYCGSQATPPPVPFLPHPSPLCLLKHVLIDDVHVP